jgi:nicotinamidase-related amidase/GrpB-like predicted nucleotidyltransferase (UPF0157 family)
VGEAALILIDFQQAIDDCSWAIAGPRNNRNAELAALRLLDSWRAGKRPVFHVRHDSLEPKSTYRPGQRGNQFKAGFEPRPDEPVVVKHTGSAFTRTALEAMLGERGIRELVIAGVITNNSVEATVRHGATLGFAITLAEDACFTFARRDWEGTLRTAAEVHAMSLANLEGEYCRVSTSAGILAVAGSPQPILPYFKEPLALRPWDDRAVAAAAYVRDLIGFDSEHVGSTSVAGCPGKGILDLLIPFAEGALPAVNERLFALGFQPQSGLEPFPETRPLRIGAFAHGGRLWRIHAHVIAASSPEVAELRYFRDLLRKDADARESYIGIKRQILDSGVRDPYAYTRQKAEFIQTRLAIFHKRLQ